jgi:hypothetical protein
MNHIVSLITILCLSHIPFVYAADSEGRFWLGGGVGSVSCSQFVSSMKQVESSETGSPSFVEATQGFTMYISGFQTGYNFSTHNTCDIFAEAKTSYELLSWVEKYCQSNPAKRFGDAVVSLGNAYHSKRKQVCTH